MESKLIQWVIKATLVFAGIAGIAASLYWSFSDGLGIVAGASWGCVNLYFLKKLLQESLKGQSRDFLKFCAWMGIKFPLLYLVGYGLLKINLFPIFSIVGGFSLIFIAIFLLGIKKLIDKDRNQVGSQA